MRGVRFRAAADCEVLSRMREPIAAPEKPAEYKQVTVLFADVVHSMDIAAAVGPERLREIMAELLDRSAAVVKRYGGTVNKFTGDGIMAVFGAPISWRTTLFAPAWPRWRFRRDADGWRPMSTAATASRCSCGSG